MKFQKLVIALAAFALCASAEAKTLKVVTTTEDLAAITRDIGGSHVDVFAIAKGYQDPHFVDAKPSYLLKMRRADLLITVGLELEVGWLPPLLTNARNENILPGSAGFLAASEGCEILQKPTGAIDRSMGDIHPEGNPHFWLDPENGRIFARNVAKKLIELDPGDGADFEKNLEKFEATLTKKEGDWQALASAFKGTKVISYHNSLPYFAKAFGLVVVNHIEPKPGVPPSPSHVQELIAQIKTDKIPLLLIEPYFDEKLPQKIAQETGATMIMFPTSVGAEPSIQTYVDLFDHDLRLITDALSGRGGAK